LWAANHLGLFKKKDKDGNQKVASASRPANKKRSNSDISSLTGDTSTAGGKKKKKKNNNNHKYELGLLAAALRPPEESLARKLHNIEKGAKGPRKGKQAPYPKHACEGT
jgi:hypothetical protein